MFRAAFITVAVVGLSDASVSRGQAPDPIKAVLEKAKATYAADMVAYRKAVLEYFDKRVDDALKEAAKTTYEADLKKFRKAVADHFDKREDDARQLGDKKQVDQIKIERKAFEEKGDLPASAPAPLKELQTAAKKAKEAVEDQQAFLLQIESERQEFESGGMLPKPVPAPLKMIPIAAATKLEAAYAQAVKEYTKTRKDDEADSVEKELELFKEKGVVKGIAKEIWAPPESYRTRSGPAKDQALKANGGNADTEAAVANGLAWLAKQQNNAGYWEFDGDAKGDRIAATGMCLLPFLAAGETHMSAKKYKERVAKGLNWLRMQMKPNGMLSGSMYSQPIATIALCEAAGMTQDKLMQKDAKRAVEFIIASQGENGSWGYTAKTEGDTSIVGWNIQALKSGKLAGITVPDKVFKQAEAFLTSVSSDSGASYGYRGPGATNTLSSVGLLCRYYMGWGPRNGSFARGVNNLASKTPPIKSSFDMYYYYYATQVVHFFGGDDWTKWNQAMRQMLMDLQITQKTTPNAKAADLGSWPKDQHFIGSQCGKLGTTALCVLTLEVYYRYPPLREPKIKAKDREEPKKASENPKPEPPGGGAVERKPGDLVEVEIASGVKMKFCWVPAGEAQLGSPTAERQAVLKLTNKVNEDVNLTAEAEEKRGKFKTKGFWLGKYEVTQEEWQTVMGNNPSFFVPAEATAKKQRISNTSRFPVDSVSWNDCQEFLKKLNDGVKVSDGMGKGIFALPHEDEWEYACRGGKGNKQAFYFGNEHNGKLANSAGVSPFGTGAKWPYLRRTAEVGSYEPLAPHPWGLCDMSGNVWEWCGTADDTFQKIRGGSWLEDCLSSQSAFRQHRVPTYQNKALGFRVARVPVGE